MRREPELEAGRRKATKEGTKTMNWLINAVTQDVGRGLRSVPQTELVLDAAGLKVTR